MQYSILIIIRVSRWNTLTVGVEVGVQGLFYFKKYVLFLYSVFDMNLVGITTGKDLLVRSQQLRKISGFVLGCCIPTRAIESLGA